MSKFSRVWKYLTKLWHQMNYFASNKKAVCVIFLSPYGNTFCFWSLQNLERARLDHHDQLRATLKKVVCNLLLSIIWLRLTQKKQAFSRNIWQLIHNHSWFIHMFHLSKSVQNTCTVTISTSNLRNTIKKYTNPVDQNKKKLNYVL